VGKTQKEEEEEVVDEEDMRGSDEDVHNGCSRGG